MTPQRSSAGGAPAPLAHSTTSGRHPGPDMTRSLSSGLCPTMRSAPMSSFPWAPPTSRSATRTARTARYENAPEPDRDTPLDEPVDEVRRQDPEAPALGAVEGADELADPPEPQEPS